MVPPQISRVRSLEDSPALSADQTVMAGSLEIVLLTSLSIYQALELSADVDSLSSSNL